MFLKIGSLYAFSQLLRFDHSDVRSLITHVICYTPRMTKTVAIISIVIVLGAIAVFFLFGTDSAEPQGPVEETPQTQECNADAKICPDGSSVGRVGLNCEFAACPSPDATSTTLTTYLGGSVTGMNVTLQPKEIVSDSRCAEGVQCIWAGTVELRTVMSTQVAHGEQVLTLNKPARFGDFTITLTDVTPYPKADSKIPESSYRFTFKLEKK